MAASFVKQTQGGLSTASTSWTITTLTATAGNALILTLAGSSGSSGTSTAVTDTGGNTWTKAWAIGGSGLSNTFLACWFCPTLVATPGTITLTTSSQTFQWSAIEFSGVLNSTTPDVNRSAANAAALTQSTPGTTNSTTVSGDAIVGAIQYGGTATSTLQTGSGGWNPATDPAAVGSNHLRVAYKTGSAAQAEQATWNLSASQAAGAGLLALKPSAVVFPQTSPQVVSQAVTQAYNR